MNLYFDFLSPFSAIYIQRLNSEAQKNSLNLNSKLHLRPLMMGMLFDYFQFPGPATIEVKRNYLRDYCLQLGRRYDIFITDPQTFPFNPLPSLKIFALSLLLEKKDLDHLASCAQLFRDIWSGKINPEDEDAIICALAFNNEEKLQLTQMSRDRLLGKKAKNLLKENLNHAIERRIFGVPTMHIDELDQFFWGNERFDEVLNFLKNEGTNL